LRPSLTVDLDYSLEEGISPQSFGYHEELFNEVDRISEGYLAGSVIEQVKGLVSDTRRAIDDVLDVLVMRSSLLEPFAKKIGVSAVLSQNFRN